jgi:hypothetical protein
MGDHCTLQVYSGESEEKELSFPENTTVAKFSLFRCVQSTRAQGASVIGRDLERVGNI